MRIKNQELRQDYESFKDMPIWQKAMDLGVKIFEISEKFPKKEDYGLTSQMRRAALSVSANISEAFGRYHHADKLNFYYNSRGSLTETYNYCIYANRVGYITPEIFKDLRTDIERLWEEVNKIIVTLRSKKKLDQK